jgi:hypothetical protein
MYDITIGKNKGKRTCSWVMTKYMYNGKDHTVSLSHNSTSFLITGLVLGFGVLVYKNTTVGKRIEETKDLPEKYRTKSEAKIIKTLNKELFKRIPIEVILRKIKEETDGAYDKGVKDARQKIREALGVF